MQKYHLSAIFKNSIVIYALIYHKEDALRCISPTSKTGIYRLCHDHADDDSEFAQNDFSETLKQATQTLTIWVPLTIAVPTKSSPQ